KVFGALRDADMDWVTYRRAPLVAPTVGPRWSWTMLEGRRVTTKVADEVVTLEGYGQARQLSVHEGEKVVFQIITSDLMTPAAALVRALRRRWSIENAFKYLEDHHGIHWLCDYQMDVGPDPRKVPNPARQEARATLAKAEAALAGAERALAQNFTDPAIAPREANAASPGLQRDIESARADLDDAEDALRGIPAKVGATELAPDAERARPRLAVRSLQMVCRLLSYNAELDLARHLDAYLDDPDEYRAITRNLLHLPGRIGFGAARITVSLRRPDSPRLARALGLLIDELNAIPARIPGDRRPLTYRIEGVPA
ncbi:MAG: putative transposase, partial [Candidatus Dormibacteria bacterium]